MEDVIVCGAGPAGCAAAITISRASPTARILLLEAGSYPRPKVCGEFLSPEATALYQSLVADSNDLSSAIRIERVTFHSSAARATLRLPRPALSLTRNVLDHSLWCAASASQVECHEKTRVLHVRRLDDTFEVQTSRDLLQARAVINATGRWSELNNSIEGRTRLIGIKCHFETSEAGPAVCNLHFFPGGYLGRQPIAHNAVSASALVDASRFRNLQDVFSAVNLQDVTAEWKPTMDPITCPPIRFTTPQPTGDGCLNCGDAAAFIDPFAGDGISLALHSGVLAGRIALSGLSGTSIDDVAKLYCREYLTHFAGAFRYAARIRSFALSNSGWKRSLLINGLRFPPLAQAALLRTRASHFA